LNFIENIRLQAALPSVNVLLQQSGTKPDTHLAVWHASVFLEYHGAVERCYGSDLSLHRRPELAAAVLPHKNAMMSGLQKILTVTIQQAAKCLQLGSYEIIARRVRQCALAFIITSGFNAVLAAQAYSPPANHRVDINLDAGWKFIRQDVAGAQNAGF